MSKFKKPIVISVIALAALGLVGLSALVAGSTIYNKSSQAAKTEGDGASIVAVIDDAVFQSVASVTPTLTNPDLTSDEDEDIGIYEGVEIGIAPEGYHAYEAEFRERLYSDFESMLMFRGLAPEETVIDTELNTITFTGNDFVLTMNDVGEGEIIHYASAPVFFNTANLGNYLRWSTPGSNIYTYASKIEVTADSHDSAGNCLYLGEVFLAPCGVTSLGLGHNLGANGDLGAFEVSCRATTKNGLAKCDFIMQELVVTEL